MDTGGLKVLDRLKGLGGNVRPRVGSSRKRLAFVQSLERIFNLLPSPGLQLPWTPSKESTEWLLLPQLSWL